MGNVILGTQDGVTKSPPSKSEPGGDSVLFRVMVLPLIPGIILAMALTTKMGLAADNNVHLYGALVAEPCVISPGDEEIQLEFGTIVDKYLYKYTRTKGQAFEIGLAACDLSLGNVVKVTFSGTEDPELPGLLSLDGNSEASGIGIGLETQSSQMLAINQKSSSFPLQDGNSTIALQAYVQGENSAIANHSIGRGGFTATATFQLDYE